MRYDVLIEKGLLSHCGEKTAEVFSPQKSAAAIITDDNVSALYLNTVVRSFEQAGFRVCHFTFLHGEDSKSHAVLMNVYDFLIQNHITRSDFIMALGGGVVGDLAGFAAATYLRGIPFIQIPTTFLAAIDSSVGGKTAVNIPAGKNLIGAFHQPSLVLCDPNTFDTLSEQTFAEGCAEMIKYAMIWSRDFFDLLESCDIHPVSYTHLAVQLTVIFRVMGAVEQEIEQTRADHLTALRQQKLLQVVVSQRRVFDINLSDHADLDLLLIAALHPIKAFDDAHLSLIHIFVIF